MYVLYDTGCSFGRNQNIVSYIELTESYEDAKFIQNIINKTQTKIENLSNGEAEKTRDFSYNNLQLPSGKKVCFHDARNGYFERFIDVRIKRIGLI